MTRPSSKPPAKADEAPTRTLSFKSQIEEIEDSAGAAELLRRILKAQAAEEMEEREDDAA